MTPVMTPPLDPLDLFSGDILGDQVFTSIGSAIVDGRLVPGQRLRDVELATQLGISRTPVREALQRLERIGLVEVAVGRYTRVTTPDDRLRADTADFAAYFFGNALRLALARCSDAGLSRILAAADHVVEESAQGRSFSRFTVGLALLRLVTEESHNRLFIGFMQEAAFAIERNMSGWEPFLRDPSARTAGYRALRDAIARRDGDAAEKTLRHLRELI